jgi:hypothetical protein
MLTSSATRPRRSAAAAVLSQVSRYRASGQLAHTEQRLAVLAGAPEAGLAWFRSKSISAVGAMLNPVSDITSRSCHFAEVAVSLLIESQRRLPAICFAQVRFVGTAARATRRRQPSFHQTDRAFLYLAWAASQPLPQLRPTPPPRDVLHGDCHGLLLADEHDQLLAACDARVDQVALTSDMSCYDRKAQRQGDVAEVGNPTPVPPGKSLILLRFDVA